MLEIEFQYFSEPRESPVLVLGSTWPWKYLTGGIFYLALTL